MVANEFLEQAWVNEVTELARLHASSPRPDASMSTEAAWYEQKAAVHVLLAAAAGHRGNRVEQARERWYAELAAMHAERLRAEQPAGVDGGAAIDTAVEGRAAA